MAFFDTMPRPVGLGIFLAMGWMGVFSLYVGWRDYGWRVAAPMIYGGLFYTAGSIGNGLRWPTIIPGVWGAHETHHLTVLAGLAVHWWMASRVAAGEFQPNGSPSKEARRKGEARLSAF